MDPGGVENENGVPQRGARRFDAVSLWLRARGVGDRRAGGGFRGGEAQPHADRGEREAEHGASDGRGHRIDGKVNTQPMIPPAIVPSMIPTKASPTGTRRSSPHHATGSSTLPSSAPFTPATIIPSENGPTPDFSEMLNARYAAATAVSAPNTNLATSSAAVTPRIRGRVIFILLVVESSPAQRAVGSRLLDRLEQARRLPL
ncbi:MAG TPA: hypothetical protein VGB15_24380 [Longimicrobium sp.]